MRVRLFVFLLVQALLLVAAEPALAEPTLTIDLILPHAEDVRNDCNGDIVSLTGQEHVVDVITLRDDGSEHHKFHTNAHLQGFGLTFDQYLADQTEDDEFDVPAGVTAQHVSTFVAVNQTNPKLSMKLIFEMHINTQAKQVERMNTVAKCNPTPVI